MERVPRPWQHERMRRGRAGGVEIGGTAAILLIVAGWILVDQMGWWSDWSWWGKGLFVLGALAVYLLGLTFEQSRTRPPPPPGG